MEKLKFIDLFCGIGGFRLAFDKLGCECVFSSDIDKYAQETYEHNFGEKPIGDITKIDEKDIPKFDILLAGFPCQPFSYSGTKDGFKDKTRGTLFFDIVRILDFHKPKMFLLENVKGIVRPLQRSTSRQSGQMPNGVSLRSGPILSGRPMFSICCSS